MGWIGRVTVAFHTGIRVLSISALLAGAAWNAEIGLAMQESGDGSAIRIVHGVANAGPLDVYVDGGIALIGIVLGESSGRLVVGAGDHEFAVVPTGSAPEASIADGQIYLEVGTVSYAALLGTAEEASVGLYAIDDRPIDAGAARFRIVSGVSDTGEIVPAFAGGDALSEPLGFGDVSQYAAIDAGAYDLDVLDAISGEVLLSLPQTSFAEGAATDIFLYGLLSDGTVQALVIPTTLETAAIEGRVARILSGQCSTPGPLAAELGAMQEGQGPVVGIPDTPVVVQGFGLAPVSFDALAATPHAVAVFESEDEDGLTVACGEIGGPLTDTGALVIALEPGVAGGPGGVAVLAPSLENPDATGVSIFLTGFMANDTPGPADAVSEEDAG